MAAPSLSRREMLGALGATALCGYHAPAMGAGFSSRRISVTVRGNGQDVILIPGLTATRAVWDETVRMLPSYRYHMVQLAGFAGDAVLDNGKGPVVEPVAREIVRYIIAAELKAPALVGHSMGGLIALMIAARWPMRTSRTMVVDMLPAPTSGLGGSVSGMRPLANGLRDVLTGSPEGRQLFGSLMGMFSPPAQTKSDPDMVARALHDIALTDLRPELGRITTPLSVVYATVPGAQYDAATVDRIYRDAYRTAPKAQLHRIAGAGHMIMTDQPQRFSATLKSFLG